MANEPETLIANVAQGNCGLVQRLIQTPSQYRALTPRTPPTERARTRGQTSTPRPPRPPGPGSGLGREQDDLDAPGGEIPGLLDERPRGVVAEPDGGDLAGAEPPLGVDRVPADEVL